MLRLTQTLCLASVIYLDCRFLFLFIFCLCVAMLVPLQLRIFFQGRPGKVRQQQKYRGATKRHRERNVWPKSSKMYITTELSKHPKGDIFCRVAKGGMLFQAFHFRLYQLFEFQVILQQDPWWDCGVSKCPSPVSVRACCTACMKRFWVNTESTVSAPMEEPAGCQSSPSYPRTQPARVSQSFTISY